MQILRKYIYGGHVGEYMEEMMVSGQCTVLNAPFFETFGLFCEYMEEMMARGNLLVLTMHQFLLECILSGLQ